MDAHELVGGTLRDLCEAALTSLTGVANDAPHDDPAEAVHDMRVALRRLRSALKPVRVLYGRRVVDSAEEHLRAALMLTSDLRDEEVLRETLQDLAISTEGRSTLDTWMRGRARREHGLRSRTTAHLRAALAASDGVVGAVRVFEHRVTIGARRRIAAGSFLRASIEEAVDVLESRAETATIGDVNAMHRVRISSKKLRYTAALLSERLGDGHPLAMTKPFLGTIEKSATKLQKRLGQLHDVDEARLRMGRAWGLDRARRNEVLSALEGLRTKIAATSLADLETERTKIRLAARRTSELVVVDEPAPLLERTPDA